jgi:hypothetical protein
MEPKVEILAQIEAVLSLYQSKRARSKYSDLRDIDDVQVTSLITLICDTVKRFSPPGSQYADSINSLTKSYGVGNSSMVPHAIGVLTALQHAYQAGFLTRISELIHADLFADFIEMAEYLLAEGYKDPAAVITGSVLEEHLRQLCAKGAIPTTQSGRAKKADQLNSDLAAASVYSKLDQKSITSWLDLRNKAAHGKYNEYTHEQVSLLLHSVRDFMARVPA